MATTCVPPASLDSKPTRSDQNPYVKETHLVRLHAATPHDAVRGPHAPPASSGRDNGAESAEAIRLERVSFRKRHFSTAYQAPYFWRSYLFLLRFLHQLDLEQFGPILPRHKQAVSIGIVGDPVQFVSTLLIQRG